MIQTLTQEIKTFIKEKSFVKTTAQVVLGSLFLALASQIEIPLIPVPVTLQTLAVFMLALTLGAKKAVLSTILYLIEVTLGLPVLAGGAIKPLWITTMTAGYLISFPFAAYLIGKLSEKKNANTLWIAFSIFCGQCIIFTMGAFWLSFFVGFKESISLGVIPFLFPALLKLIIATSYKKGLS